MIDYGLYNSHSERLKQKYKHLFRKGSEDTSKFFKQRFFSCSIGFETIKGRYWCNNDTVFSNETLRQPAYYSEAIEDCKDAGIFTPLISKAESRPLLTELFAEGFVRTKVQYEVIAQTYT